MSFLSDSRKSPFRKRKFFSNSLLIGFSIAILFVLFFGDSDTSIVKVVLSALEGGLIGGLCDWFAVWKTYKAIEEDSFKLSSEIGNWVADDLLHHEVIRSRIKMVLEDPSTRDEVHEVLLETFGDEEKTNEVLNRLFSKVEEEIVQYVVHYQFSGTDVEILKELNRQKEIIDTIKLLIGESMIKVADTEEFKSLLKEILGKMHLVAQVVLNLVVDFPKKLKEYGNHVKQGLIIESKDEKTIEKLVNLMAASAETYISSWNELHLDQREKAVRSLMGFLKDQASRLLGTLVQKHLQEIGEIKTLQEYAPLRSIFEFVEKRIDEGVSGYIGKQITSRLQSLDPKDLRKNLEWKTRNVLETIRINGSILGFFLGSVTGLIKLFFWN
ncbi:PF04286 family protein [Leptospira weilii serovar Topaz str. LT2116]|uniref:PF04286 family protein n=1 Tax=Leptospira weilii serovar Topaz str. LT2116 TaxID=1088540 RepID=M3EEE7_9LEPT|nr:PF04286 family protein [Leptospira weilii serovar Topaz str. LT2116]